MKMPWTQMKRKSREFAFIMIIIFGIFVFCWGWLLVVDGNAEVKKNWQPENYRQLIHEQEVEIIDIGLCVATNSYECGKKNCETHPLDDEPYEPNDYNEYFKQGHKAGAKAKIWGGVEWDEPDIMDCIKELTRAFKLHLANDHSDIYVMKKDGEIYFKGTKIYFKSEDD